MEEVILVHGTFATDPVDEGQRWWQRGSSFWEALGAALAGGASLPSDGRLYRWSGSNNYTARRRGAVELLEHLEVLERKGRGYHLVAHSHGGSVVWEALLLSEMPQWRQRFSLGDSKDTPALKGLRSWTTVGTPFVHWRPSTLSRLLYYVLVPIGVLSWIAIISMLVFLLVSPNWFVVAGKFWLMLLVILVLLAASRSAGVAAMFHRERLLANTILHQHGRKWLALWCEDDEAINGLGTATQCDEPIITRQNSLGLDPIYDFAWYSRLHDMVLWPLSALRVLLAPLGDRIIWSALRKKATGADRPGMLVTGVSTSPEAGLARPNPLFRSIADEVITIADRYLLSFGQKARELLLKLNMHTVETVVGDRGELESHEMGLVHTAYFESPSIIGLIAGQIDEMTVGKVSASTNDEIRGFLEQQRQSQIDNINNFLTESQCASSKGKVKRMVKVVVNAALTAGIVAAYFAGLAWMSG